MSSTESELNALSDGEQENQWLSFLIEELWQLDLPPTLFHIDNKGLLEKLKNFGSNSKTKHLDIKIKSLREKFNDKVIYVQLIPSKDMIADSLSKAAPYDSLSSSDPQAATSKLKPQDQQSNLRPQASINVKPYFDNSQSEKSENLKHFNTPNYVKGKRLNTGRFKPQITEASQRPAREVEEKPYSTIKRHLT
ncbi:hypothetical protein PCANC_02944 [Puccinia coronata f. sp. avenae]|uniref:Reverse transcriptase Ty1/copia-type domain-containing protein n=1 Tax=Puccinia coronata f. sp. avenae TaxID=200324 RepID=A0A2N5T8I9_9BASI|nr:hypothetical protein PCANC_02944 [Puccinia coronata f. sp. avenae]